MSSMVKKFIYGSYKNNRNLQGLMRLDLVVTQQKCSSREGVFLTNSVSSKQVPTHTTPHYVIEVVPLGIATEGAVMN